MAEARRDQNRVTTLIGESSAGETPINVYVNPVTHELYVTDSNTTTIASNTKVFGLNGIDDTTTTDVTYIGSETGSGEWKIMKMDESGGFPVFTYASVTNNPTLLSYTLAWAARATTAVYDDYNTAF